MAHKKKKLSKTDLARLWGEDTPYSQVRLSEESRILGDGISRIFLVVETEINPFTFEYVLTHRHEFADDPAIQELLDHAEYRGPAFGYVVCAGREELIDKKSFDLAFSYREMAAENILKMHELVIRNFGLKRSSRKGIKKGIKIEDAIDDGKYIWGETSGQVLSAEDELWDSGAIISSPAGDKDGKIRYFVVMALASGPTLNASQTKWSASCIKAAADKFGVKVEQAEAGMGYMMFTVLIAPTIAPADFIETSIRETNRKAKLLNKNYFITNFSRPTGNEVERFLRDLK